MQPLLEASSDICHVAREYFGYQSLRPGQEVAIRSVVSGRDTLAIMPTGAGKSAIYQISSLLIPGPSVIVSPLIALQHDQMEAINARRAGTAAIVNSLMSEKEREHSFAALESGGVDFIFMAPEQFANSETLERIRRVNPSLFVVDEAHCVSEWGHDFRPDYLRLGDIVEALGHPRVLAMTATAAPPVRDEIITRLGLADPNVIVRDFDRPNIWFGVQHFHDEQAKRQALVGGVLECERPGIVYVATHQHAEEVAAELRAAGVRAVHYHAGMRADEREAAYESFMNDTSEVVVATTAFGMGIDKPHVRFVFHYDVSESLDAYYQEVGRAGRDGEPARAVLFYLSDDLNLRRFLGTSGHLDPEDVERVARAVQRARGPISRRELAQQTKLSQAKVAATLNWLDEIGVLEVQPTGEVVSLRRHGSLHKAAVEAAHLQEQRREFEQSRIEMMRGYAEESGCRRQFLLNYFGEELADPCGNCDDCEAGKSEEHLPTDMPYPLNSRVRHRLLGDGLVMRYEDDTMVVLFDEVGYKTLAVPLVVESSLLEPLT